MEKTLVYQLYPIAWEEEGGLSAMRRHLYHVSELGANYVWFSPLYPSPRCDHGYDVADYMAIDSRFGTMADFDYFVETAHRLGIKVLMDLVLNHVSVEHEWFQNSAFRKKFFWWFQEDHPGWKNHFNGGPALKYLEEEQAFYFHSFDEGQADLKLFPNGPDGDVNWELVKQFHGIIDFWIQEHGVDGFRLDIPQSINKDFSDDDFTLESVLYGDQAVGVLNALFGNTDCFLMMECFDPSMGELTEYYLDETPVDFVCNVLLKDEFGPDIVNSFDLVSRQAQNPHFMLDLESHDSQRFLSRGVSLQDELWYLFDSGASAICLYQGQELGLLNPTRDELPNELMLALDTQAAMRYANSENPDDFWPCRAATRVPLPSEEYYRQKQDPNSCFNLFKEAIHTWRQS